MNRRALLAGVPAVVVGLPAQGAPAVQGGQKLAQPAPVSRQPDAEHPDAALLTLCARLRDMQAEWQRLFDACPVTPHYADEVFDTPAQRAFNTYSTTVWPGTRLADNLHSMPPWGDAVRAMADIPATTPEGRQAKAAALLAVHETVSYCDFRDDGIDLSEIVLREAAGAAAIPVGRAA